MTTQTTPENPCDGVQYLQQARVVRVQPGDTLVLESPTDLRPDQVAGIRATMKRLFPDCRVLILSEGWRLGVLTRDRVEPGHESDGET